MRAVRSMKIVARIFLLSYLTVTLASYPEHLIGLFFIFVSWQDQTLVREGIQSLLHLTEDIRVVATASDGEEASEIIEAAKPDVVLLDVRIPKKNGLEVLRELQQLKSPPSTIILTTFDDDQVVLEGIKALFLSQSEVGSGSLRICIFETGQTLHVARLLTPSVIVTNREKIRDTDPTLGCKGRRKIAGHSHRSVVSSRYSAFPSAKQQSAMP
jgi:CheY-like chemotaxis protein